MGFLDGYGLVVTSWIMAYSVLLPFIEEGGGRAFIYLNKALWSGCVQSKGVPKKSKFKRSDGSFSDSSNSFIRQVSYPVQSSDKFEAVHCTFFNHLNSDRWISPWKHAFLPLCTFMHAGMILPPLFKKINWTNPEFNFFF